MGREAQVVCRVPGDAEVVKAQLESTDLILRGVRIKRRFVLAQLQDLTVVADSLQFVGDGEPVALQLGAAEAAKWLKKISTPPPGLAAKLGISAEQPAWFFGPLDDPVLTLALAGASTSTVADAHVMVAVVLSADALKQALQQHTQMPGRALWLVNEKGPRAGLGDSAIRTALRAQGYMDNKTTAVSERLSATRYAKR
jgi:hypothetical protein